MKLIKRLLLTLFVALLAFLPGSSKAVSTITITGVWDNQFGNPCVYCHLDIYALNPTMFSSGGGTLVSNNPIQFLTDTSGNVNATVVGSITAALYFEETGALIKTTLPASGTTTLAAIQAGQPNVVSAFPPLGNLPMGGYHFTGMSGGQATGDSVAVGTGLDTALIQSGSGTLTPPTGSTYCDVLLKGGGGGGGGGNTGGINGGGGGGGGAVAKCQFLASNGPIAISLGAAGTGGAAATDGTDGADSTATQTGVSAICTASHGHLGSHGSGGGAGTKGNGGSAGTGTGPAQLLFTTVGQDGVNGSSGGGGAGGGGGQFGGNGGAPSSGTGSDGAIGYAIAWCY